MSVLTAEYIYQCRCVAVTVPCTVRAPCFISLTDCMRMHIYLLLYHILSLGMEYRMYLAGHGPPFHRAGVSDRSYSTQLYSAVCSRNYTCIAVSSPTEPARQAATYCILTHMKLKSGVYRVYVQYIQYEKSPLGILFLPTYNISHIYSIPSIPPGRSASQCSESHNHPLGMMGE